MSEAVYSEPYSDIAYADGMALVPIVGAAVLSGCPPLLTLNSAARRMFALPETMEPVAFVKRLHREDRIFAAKVLRGATDYLAELSEHPLRIKGDDDIWHWGRVHPVGVEAAADGSAQWRFSIVDVTREMGELDRVKRRAEHLRYTVEMNPQLPWCGEADGKLIEVTDRWLELTGLTREQALGFDAWTLTAHPEDVEMALEAITYSMTVGIPLDIRVRVRVAQGGYRWMRATAYPRKDENGQIIRWYGYTEDIHEHVLVEQKIRWTAEHDTLTGLPNRMLFSRRLESAIDQALQKLSRVGLLVLDVDQFKEVNDLLGHDAGDALLRSFARKLLVSLPGPATIARIGGDEFAVLLPGITSPNELTKYCDAIFEALREPVHFEGRNIECRTSIGAALYPDHGRRSSELMKHADLALYAAKSAGRGRLMIFESTMHDEMRRRVAMVNRGRAAVEDGAIIPYYQPKIALATGEIAGFEALLRWRDRRGRIFTPGSISAAFEEPDVAEAMGAVMLDLIFRDMKAWGGMGLNFGHVAVNAAPAEFRRDLLATRVIESLEKTGIHPSQIQLEVTEGVFLGRGAYHAESAIRRLHDYGVSIALDDFGTGFASLSHLRQFPVDTIKIDRSFVSDVAELADDAAIVAAIVNLGRNLNMKVVAEGIETVEQAMTLRDQGCEFGQGFLFCRPIPAHEIPDLLRNWTPDLKNLQGMDRRKSGRQIEAA